MTVSNQIARSGPYLADGIVTTFGRTFKLLNASHIRVVQTVGGVDTQITTGFSQTNVPGETGNVIFAVAPADGAQITLYRDIPLTQETDYSSQGSVDPEVIERDLDLQVMRQQDLGDRLGRALVSPESDGTLDMVLPKDRASRFLAFDANKRPIAAVGVGSAPVSAAVEPVVAAATLADARAELGVDALVSVTQYGATGDGTTNDTAAVQAAINGSLNVYFPPGTYSCGQLTLRSNLNLVGAGQGVAILRHRSGTNAFGLFGTGVLGVRISGLTLDGNSAGNTTGGMGVRLEGVSSHIRIEDCRVTDWRFDGIASVSTGSYLDVVNCRIESNLRDGVSTTGTLSASVQGCRIIGNGRFGVVFGAGSHYCRLANNGIFTNSATDALGCGALAISLTDATFVGNVAVGNTLGHGLQFNAVTRGAMAGNVSRNNGISGLDSFASTYVTFSGNVSFDNAVRGIEIDSSAFYNVVDGNVVYRNGGAGISVFRSPGTLVIGNVASENGTGLPPGLEFSPGVPLPPEPYGIRLWDTANTLPSNNCRIIGNLATDDRGGSASQTHGISIEAASTVGVAIIGNTLSPNLTGPVSAVAGSVSRARDNLGWATQAEGGGTIPSGSTSVVVTHGLAVTPAAEAILVTPTNSPTSDPGNMWISGITSTQFTVNCRANPGTSGLNFRWRASVY
jgi:parallel beta-helix repeat protein